MMIIIWVNWQKGAKIGDDEECNANVEPAQASSGQNSMTVSLRQRPRAGLLKGPSAVGYTVPPSDTEQRTSVLVCTGTNVESESACKLVITKHMIRNARPAGGTENRHPCEI